MTTRLPWQGRETVDRIAENLTNRRRTVLKLAAAYHHARRLRLNPQKHNRGLIDLSGDATLLKRVASVAGLGTLHALATPMHDANARVRVRSAPPQLVFEVPIDRPVLRRG